MEEGPGGARDSWDGDEEWSVLRICPEAGPRRCVGAVMWPGKIWPKHLSAAVGGCEIGFQGIKKCLWEVMRSLEDV